MPFYQGVYRSDPPPVQPVPHVPIPAQGQTPPKGPTQLLVDSIIVKWSWEPPPPMPRQLPLTIAPLTLTYGQQPPKGPTQLLVDSIIVKWSWEPPPPMPRQKPLTQAPLTLTYGQQPPKGPTQLLVDSIVVKWSWEPPPPMPRQLPLTVAPLTLTYGQQPPIGCLPFTIAENVIYSAWQPPWYPAQSQAPVAPLTLTYGDQPPKLGGETDPDKFYTAITTAWIPPDPPPQLPLRRYIAPQTLVYGQQPPPLVRQAVPQQPEGWMPQARSQVASLIPTVTFVSFLRLPDSVLASWRQGDPQPTLPRYIAPLTLTYGQQPPQIRTNVPRQWWTPPDPMPQTLLGVAPFQITPFVPSSLPANLATIIRSWQPVEPPIQKVRYIAPLTLRYGDQPPRYSTRILATIADAWVPPFYYPPRLIVGVQGVTRHAAIVCVTGQYVRTLDVTGIYGRVLDVTGEYVDTVVVSGLYPEC